MTRQAISTRAALLAAAAVFACRAAPPAGDMVAADLISDFQQTECRPSGACTVDVHGVPTIRVSVPSRLIWKLPLPHGGHLHVQGAATGTAHVRLRVGISDVRVYEGLREITLAPGAPPAPLDVDLSAYAGRKWSFFYHPDAVTWRLTFSADAVDGARTWAIWQRPEIFTSRDAAREYQERIRP